VNHQNSIDKNGVYGAVTNGGLLDLFVQGVPIKRGDDRINGSRFKSLDCALSETPKGVPGGLLAPNLVERLAKASGWPIPGGVLADIGPSPLRARGFFRIHVFDETLFCRF
jgi:hypothetical protein